MIQHVALEVREQDVEACVRFWALLGFDQVDPPPALTARSAWVQAGATQIHLLFAGAPVLPTVGHVAVIVEDYDATFAALREAGWPPQRRTEHWGSARCMVHCPAGHRVEVMAFRP